MYDISFSNFSDVLPAITCVRANGSLLIFWLLFHDLHHMQLYVPF